MSKIIRGADFTVNTNDVDRFIVKSTGTTDFLTHGITNFTIQDATDNTKEVSFNLTGISTGITRAVVFPNVNGTVVFNDNTAILTLKSINLANNTITGTLAEFNTALSDETFVTVGGSEVLIGKTFTLPQINDTSSDHQYIFAVNELTADRTITLPLLAANDIFTFNDFAATLTNKSIDFATNTISGTLAQFNTAISDDDILPISGGTITGDLLVDGSFHTKDAGELTISSGTITVTGSYHTVDTEADASSDELDTINGGVDGAILVMQSESSARNIRITRAGNINAKTDPMVLGHVQDAVTLKYSGALSAWVVTAYQHNGNGTFPSLIRNYHFQSFAGSSGTNYISGFYDLIAADLNLNQGAPTGTAGGVNIASGAHAILVAGGVGAVSGGSTGTAIITVSGTSITDAGVRNASASEIIITDVTDSAQMTADTYHETVLKWIGLVTYTITTDGDRTTFNADFNVGLAKYEDLLNNDFIVSSFEIVGLAGAADTSFNVTLCEHSASGWTYHVSAFVTPTGNEIADMNTDYNTEVNLANGDSFAYKRTDLMTLISGSEAAPTTTVPNGILIRIVTSANASVQSMDAHVGVIPV